MSGELISVFGGKVPQRAIRQLDKLPYVASYQLDEDNIIAGVDFGGADETFIIQTHGSKRAKVVEALVYDITENFAGTTKAAILFGDGSDADGFAYTDDFVDAEMTTAVGSKHFSSAAGSITAGALDSNGIIEAGDYLTVTCRAAITGPTGIGRVAVSLLYFD
jgi:hypothetical protein